MAATKRYTAEQIVAKLREAERLQGQGATIPQVCKKLGISEQTFYRWRLKYGAMKEDEAIRLKTLEQENARLKRIVAEQALDISIDQPPSAGPSRVRVPGPVGALAAPGRPPQIWSTCGGGRHSHAPPPRWSSVI